MQTKFERMQMWIACCLTVGEWVIAIVVLVHKAEWVMLYLAATYTIRETSGGKHHHEIVYHMIRRVFKKDHQE